MAKQHTLVKEFLKNHSLVESNIRSFNEFIEIRMQEIVDELSERIDSEDFEIKFGKISLDKPNQIEADGSTKLITPAEARIRKLTYSAPINVEISIKYEGQSETAEVSLGRIPIIVKSNACNLKDLSEDQLIGKYIDPSDPGGYFIVNGNERVIAMAEDLASNQTFIENKKGKLTLRLFSQRGAYKIPVTLVENNDGILEVSFSRFRGIPVIVLLKALGLTSDAEIAKLIGKQNESLIVNLYEFPEIVSSDDALMHIAEQTSLQGTKKEILDRAKQRMDSYFLPHVGLDKNSRLEKAKTLCKFVKQLFIAQENPEKSLTDKDHYGNKRVRLSGDLLSDLFRVNLNIFIREIQHSLQKTIKRNR